MTFLQHFADIKKDLWQNLSETEKPIVLYGMGDGADKIIQVLNQRKIPIAGIFASDSFVREKVFHGHKVVRYADLRERFGHMIVLVCFGTCLPDVMEHIRRIAEEQELYAPDVPVFGEGLMNLEYFKEHAPRLQAVYERLEDPVSRKTFVMALKYRLTGDIRYLSEAESSPEESYTHLLQPHESCTYVDIGAYNGDTIRQFCQYTGTDVTVHAFEPDARNFRKLSAFAAESGIKHFHVYPAAAWSQSSPLTFYARSGRCSAGTTSHAGVKAVEIQGLCADDVVKSADFVKIDAEGSDREALLGMKHLLHNSAPALYVAAYHRTDDYFLLPETVLSMQKDYRVYFRHFPYIPCWDTNFYFIPKKPQ